MKAKVECEKELGLGGAAGLGCPLLTVASRVGLTNRDCCWPTPPTTYYLHGYRFLHQLSLYLTTDQLRSLPYLGGTAHFSVHLCGVLRPTTLDHETASFGVLQLPLPPS